MIQHAFARDSLEPKCTELKIMCKRQVAVLMIMMVVKIVMMKRMVVIPAVVATKTSSLWHISVLKWHHCYGVIFFPSDIIVPIDALQLLQWPSIIIMIMMVVINTQRYDYDHTI